MRVPDASLCLGATTLKIMHYELSGSFLAKASSRDRILLVNSYASPSTLRVRSVTRYAELHPLPGIITTDS